MRLGASFLNSKERDPMMNAIAWTHDTVSTQYVEADGVRFAYRRFGKAGKAPFVFVQHFRGTMDNHDSAITNALAIDREVILFNNRGVSSTNGVARDTVDDMARDTLTFIDALGLSHVVLLGHSMGGEVAQLCALMRPDVVERLILVGTGPKGGEGMPMSPSTGALFAITYEHQDEMWLPIMFSPSERSQQAGHAWLTRTRARKDRDPQVSVETGLAHREAANRWAIKYPDGYAYLNKIDCPTLVVNGKNDIVVLTVNSYILQQNLPNARLVLYPDSNHGSHYQYHEDFVEQVKLFLNQSEVVR
jgi:pimeloyl-ACP methyl ester carboxylesterase